MDKSSNSAFHNLDTAPSQANANRKLSRTLGSTGSRPPSSETLDSPTGAHVEWCKQLIAATISSQIAGPIVSESISRDYKAASSHSFELNFNPVMQEAAYFGYFRQSRAPV